MRKIRFILTLAVSLLFAFALAACGEATKTQINGHVDDIVEALYVGWNNQAIEEDYSKNPYKKYIDEKYGIDYRVSLTSDLQTELAKRFASSKSRKPDIILFRNQDAFTMMKTLYNQGFFVEDYTPYLDLAPRLKQVFEDSPTAKAKLTENNKIIALTLPGEEPVWMFKIRQDWVDKFADGKIPSTLEELLAMAERVKQDNPKHYLFTSSGENKGFGNMESFQLMFSDYNSWYVKDGEVSHPILDGTRKKFLDFMKTLYQNGYIDPNWYTQDWTKKKINLYNGAIGIDWYPPAIATEHVYFNGNNEDYTDIWVNLPMPTDTAGVERGNLVHTFRYYFVISKDVEKDTEKMKKIMNFLNDMLYPETYDQEVRQESLYMKIRWGLGVDGYDFGEGKEIEPIYRDGEDTGFVTYYYLMNSSKHTRTQYAGSWDYGVPMATTDDRVVEYLAGSKYGKSAYNYIDLYNTAVEYYANHGRVDYSEMLNLNANILNNLDNLCDEFEITYVLGTNKMTYEQFVQEWLNYGAKTLKQSVEQQYRKAGLL